MYNRLNTYLADNNILFIKQLGFTAGHSTEHALLELIDQISDSLIDKLYFLGIFIDLSKAFDIVDHEILLKKLQHYEIKGKNWIYFNEFNLYKWFIPGTRYLKSNHVCRWHELILFEQWYKDSFLNTNLEIFKFGNLKISNKTTFTLFHKI